jgi:DNA-nicking Smr family endonuclease
MTSDSHPGSRRRSRKLDPEERRLWKAVARSVKPLRPQTADNEPDEVAPPPSAPARPPAVKSRSEPAKPAPKRAAPALAPLARRERQRLARGTAPIDARIDLHGLTQSEAHAALIRFLRRSQAAGARFVLVITGKGARFADDGRERGVLRRQVPLWLKLSEFRTYVVGFEDAHVTHGGAGALYVRLRRSPD